MSGLAHYFEDEGLATVVVALVREHAELMQPPRALWVPFELGRPFGAPADPGLQTRVLRASLALLARSGPVPVLEDFAEDAPPGAAWTFPGDLATGDLMSEARSVRPLWEQARSHRGRTTFGNSDLLPEQAVEFVARFTSDDPMPNPPGMAAISRARFATDDIKTFYLEAAVVDEQLPPSRQLHDWFWETTLAGAMIREFQEHARTSDDRNLNLIAGSLVPAERVNSRR